MNVKQNVPNVAWIIRMWVTLNDKHQHIIHLHCWFTVKQLLIKVESTINVPFANNGYLWYEVTELLICEEPAANYTGFNLT